MMRCQFRLPVVCLALILMTTSATASWEDGGTLVCGEDYIQRYVQSAPDGQGHVFLAWEDYRSGASSDIYFQKIDDLGQPQWTAGGIPAASGSDYETSPRVFSDGSDGCVVVWEESRTGPLYLLMAQHYDADGTPLWTTGGVALYASANSANGFKVASDGFGGVLATWYQSGTSAFDIYGQRVDASGTVLWGPSGVAVCTGQNSQQPALCADGTGGAIIAWNDARFGNWDIYARRIGATGTKYWLTNGTRICGDSNDQYMSTLVPDNSGGAIIAWRDFRSGDSDVYAQKVTVNGVAQWANNGIPVASGLYDQDEAACVPDGTGGGVFAWIDQRDLTNDLYVQKVSSSGTLTWVSTGVVVCNVPTQEFAPQLFLTETGNTLVAWRDFRSLNGGLFTQMVNPDGVVQWAANGLRVSDSGLETGDFNLLGDGEGGGLFAWHSYDAGAYDIWAQRVDRHGYWGYPAPRISDVRDIPGDQGGAVDVAWEASRLDPWPEMGISRYTVWRAMDHDKALNPSGQILASPADLPACDKLLVDPARDIILSQDKAGDTYYWKLISSLDAYYLGAYSEVAATLFDSTSVSAEDHHFQVIAHGATPEMFWISEPASGHSVDNLAPDSPKAFTGAADYQPGGLQLVWDPNTEADLAEYALYRSTSADFVPSPANLVTVVADTSYFDTGWTLGAGFHYKLAALDVHENSSGFTALDYADVSEVGDGVLPAATRLVGNYPNPFNPATRIAFDLDRARVVNLRIYDLAGRLVKVLLAEEAMKGGHHGVVWNGRDAAGQQAASGVYFYSLEADGLRFTDRMVMVK